MKQVLEDGDIRKVYLIAHTIKGLAGNISAPRLYQTALRLENAGRDNDIQGIKKSIPELEHEFERLSSVLGRIQANRSAL